VALKPWYSLNYTKFIVASSGSLIYWERTVVREVRIKIIVNFIKMEVLIMLTRIRRFMQSRKYLKSFD
jgi:hypothetical protein